MTGWRPVQGCLMVAGIGYNLYNLFSPNQFGKDLQIKTADVRAQTLHYKDGVTQPSLAEDKYKNYFVL